MRSFEPGCGEVVASGEAGYLLGLDHVPVHGGGFVDDAGVDHPLDRERSRDLRAGTGSARPSSPAGSRPRRLPPAAPTAGNTGTLPTIAVAVGTEAGSVSCEHIATKASRSRSAADWNGGDRRSCWPMVICVPQVQVGLRPDVSRAARSTAEESSVTVGAGGSRHAATTEAPARHPNGMMAGWQRSTSRTSPKTSASRPTASAGSGRSSRRRTSRPGGWPACSPWSRGGARSPPWSVWARATSRRARRCAPTACSACTR